MKFYFLALPLLFGTGLTQAEQPINDTFSWGGDVRAGYFSLQRDDRDNSETSTDEARLRVRIGLKAKFSDQAEAKIRFAGRYSTLESNHEHFEVFSRITAGDGLRRGDSTIDEFYLKARPADNWEVKFGRMQTKYELMGVAKKSLDRNDSPNVDITWTDGMHVTYKGNNGWRTHAIVQRNLSAGATQVRRSPLNFSDDGSRISYFIAMENTTSVGPIVQRALDVTLLPDALRKDGTANGRIDDYWAVVGRLAAQWPMQGSSKFMLAGEFGYAPNTPTRAATSTGTSGDTDGYAGQLTFNFIDFRPGHSVGLVLGVAETGWLLSPDFRNNNTLVETRYKWKLAKNQAVEARLRRREDIDQLTTAAKKREDIDAYVRYTYKF